MVYYRQPLSTVRLHGGSSFATARDRLAQVLFAAVVARARRPNWSVPMASRSITQRTANHRVDRRVDRPTAAAASKERPKVTPAPKGPAPTREFSTFLSRLAPKARAVVDKQLELSDGEAGRGKQWKRFAELMGRLAPHAVEVTGGAVRFFIADGKYRQQVFALEALETSVVRLYLPDVLAVGVARSVLVAPKVGEADIYGVVKGGGAKVVFEALNADTENLAPFCKPMLGWGRRAVRTSVDPAADEKSVQAVERLCELAAETWAPRPGEAVAQDVRS